MRWMLKTHFAQKLEGKANFAEIMQLDGARYRELDNRRTFAFSLGGENYFAKCHYGVGFAEVAKNLLKGRKLLVDAKYEWMAIHWLTQQHVPTMEAVGYGVSAGCAATRQSFLITKAIEGAQSLEEVCLGWRDTPPPTAHKRALIHRVAEMVGRMHRSGMVHRDCYLCHFLCRANSDQGFSLQLIDLHRASIYKTPSSRLLVKDLSGLAFSSQDIGLTMRDRLRFIKTYFQLTSLRDLSQVQQQLLLRVVKKSMWLYQKFHSKFGQMAVAQTGMPLLSRKDLPRLRDAECLPRALLLADQFDAVQLHKVLRYAAGKRVVALGAWRGRKVVVKLFFHPLKSWWHAKQEVHGVKLLEQHNLHTPKLVANQPVMNLAGRALIFEYIDGAKHLDAQTGAAEVQDFLLQAVPMLARTHQQGLLQQDLHPDNFIFTGTDLWCIDGSEMRQRASLSASAKMGNLALLLAQFSLKQLGDARQWFDLYVDCCGNRDTVSLGSATTSRGLTAGPTPQTWHHFTTKLWQVRAKRAQMLWEKAARNSTAIKVQQNFFWRQITARVPHPALSTQDLPATLPEWFGSDQLTMLKKGNSATVIAYPGPAGTLVIKRYNIKNAWHGMRRAFKNTRAENSWCSAALLSYLDIATAPAVAVVERRWGWIRRESYLLMLQVSGAPLDKFMLTASAQAREVVLAKIKDMTDALASCGVIHGDFKASNWLWDSEQQQLRLIDLDALHVVTDQQSFEKQWAKELQRLDRNWG